MERIPFNLQDFMNGDVAINRHGDEFQRIDERVFLLSNNSENSELYRWLGVIDRSSFRMKPKEDDIWSKWFEHDGSECPIPEVKAKDFEFKRPGGDYYKHNEWTLNADEMTSWDAVAAYRIKKHLLKPKSTQQVFKEHLPKITKKLYEAAGVDFSSKNPWDKYIKPIADSLDELQKEINKPYTPKDQYILNYVHEEPKGVLHEDEGMSRLITNLMRK